MDKKVIAIIAVVAVVIVAAAAAFVLMNNNNGGSGGGGTYENDLDELARVYGNANNDSYLNSDDVKQINKIISDKLDWKNEFPYADANNDGKVDSADVTYVQNFIDGKSQLMYYTTNTGATDYVHFPISGKIGCNYDYGYMVMQIFGQWDNVVAGLERWTTAKNTDGTWKVSENRYPGAHSFTNLGDGKDKEVLAENILKSGIRAYLGQPDTGVEQYLRAAESKDGTIVDVINLKFAQMNKYGTPVSTVMTAACMFNEQEDAKKYLDKFNSTVSEIQKRTKGLTSKTFIQPYNPSNDGPVVHVDCLGISATNGYNSMGDYWTLSLLPLKDGLGAQVAGNYIEIEKETIIAANPDIMVISLWGNITDETSPEDAQKTFETAAKYMSGVPAYSNGGTVGVCFETIGTPLGPSGLMLVASYIWPDVFSEDEGWKLLQEWYDEFTEFKGDVKQAGGLMCFKH